MTLNLENGVEVKSEDNKEKSKYKLRSEIEKILLEQLEDEYIKEKFRVIIREEVKDEVDVNIKDSNYINNGIEIEELEEREDMEDSRNPIEVYVLGIFVIAVVLFSIFYEAFMNQPIDEIAVVNNTIQNENTVLVTPIEIEEEIIEPEQDTDVISANENIIDSLFSFADAESEKKSIEDNNKLKLIVKEKLVSFLDILQNKLVE